MWVASARRAWPAMAAEVAEVVRRLVLTTSASKLCDKWLAFEIAKKSIAASVTGKRKGEKYREREHKKEVVRIGKANMARNGGGGC